MKEIKPLHMFRDTFVNVCNLCPNFSVDRTNTDVIRQLCLYFRSFFQSHLGKREGRTGAAEAQSPKASHALLSLPYCATTFSALTSALTSAS